MAQSLTGLGDISFVFFCLFFVGLKSLLNFATMNRYFLPVNIVKRVLLDVPWVYLIRIKFIFVDKMKCIPSNESCGKVIFYL